MNKIIRFRNIKELLKETKEKLDKEYSKQHWPKFKTVGLNILSEGMKLHSEAKQQREQQGNDKEFILISLSYILVSTGIEHLLKSCFLFEGQKINFDNKWVKPLGKLKDELNNLTRVKATHREGLKYGLDLLNTLRNNAAHSGIKQIKSHKIRESNCKIFDFLIELYPEIFSDLFTSTEFSEFRKVYSNYDPREK